MFAALGQLQQLQEGFAALLGRLALPSAYWRCQVGAQGYPGPYTSGPALPVTVGLPDEWPAVQVHTADPYSYRWVGPFREPTPLVAGVAPAAVLWRPPGAVGVEITLQIGGNFLISCGG